MIFRSGNEKTTMAARPRWLCAGYEASTPATVVTESSAMLDVSCTIKGHSRRWIAIASSTETSQPCSTSAIVAAFLCYFVTVSNESAQADFVVAVGHPQARFHLPPTPPAPMPLRAAARSTAWRWWSWPVGSLRWTAVRHAPHDQGQESAPCTSSAAEYAALIDQSAPWSAPHRPTRF